MLVSRSTVATMKKMSSMNTMSGSDAVVNSGSVLELLR
jgi:hypothetical protein